MVRGSVAIKSFNSIRCPSTGVYRIRNTCQERNNERYRGSFLAPVGERLTPFWDQWSICGTTGRSEVRLVDLRYDWSIYGTSGRSAVRVVGLRYEWSICGTSGRSAVRVVDLRYTVVATSLLPKIHGSLKYAALHSLVRPGILYGLQAGSSTSPHISSVTNAACNSNSNVTYLVSC